MTKRMLIDATHAEETRVVVLDGSRLEDFDVETSTKKQLKGNIYLAKVVRVEPSLQAPSSSTAATGTASSPSARSTRTITRYRSPTGSACSTCRPRTPGASRTKTIARRWPHRPAKPPANPNLPTSHIPTADDDTTDDADDTANGAEEGDDGRERRIPPRFLRNYKIQEVIRRRQILLVQVVKEERGTKGAALTTYLSLAGRFSRADAELAARRRHIAQDHLGRRPPPAEGDHAELDIPKGMGLIVRTAGAQRRSRRSSATANICCGCGTTSASTR
jgi:ribonuclease E